MALLKHAAIVGLLVVLSPSASAKGSPLDQAWARVVASQPAGEDPGEEGRAVRHWFLGFVEGKTGVAPPEYWRQSVLNCRLDRLPLFFFLSGDFEHPYHWTKDFIECPRDTDVVFGDGSVKIKAGPESVEFTDVETIAVIKGAEYLSTAWVEDRVYLALHRSVDECEVHAIDRKSKHTLWTAKIRPTENEPFAISGPTSHFVTMFPHGDKIVVYGATSFSGYVASIEPRSGRVTWHSALDAARKDREAVAEIIALIDGMPVWPLAPVTGEGLTEEAEADAKEIERIAAKIATYDLDLVRIAIAQVERTNDDERLLWLNKYLFAIPSRLPANSPHIGRNFNAGWAGSLPYEDFETANQNGATIWPWVEAEDGTLQFSRDVNGVIYNGPPYQAERAFNFYRSTFGPRHGTKAMSKRENR